MPYELEPFRDVGLTEASLAALLDEHERSTLPALERLWSYYRNPIGAGGADGRPRQAQENGLPARLREGGPDGGDPPPAVVENDIGWRIDALVDFVAGKPIRLKSVAADASVRERVDRALEEVWEASGGMALLQDAVLLASVHGWVDFVVRAGEGRAGPRVEVVEAARAVPVVDPSDYRRVLALVIRSTRREMGGAGRGAIGRWVGGRRPGRHGPARGGFIEREVIEILSASRRQVYVEGALALDEANGLGELPVAHVQNLRQPFRYGGLSDVEPLIPLQDELNTRLTDRAHRVTMQSFKMYLAKGFELTRSGGPAPIGPGRIWVTDNPEASIEAFGGDGHSPAEEQHIEELREAMDKASSVSPVVLGVVRARLGHLSSVNALRITMLGILSKTARKRSTITRGIAEVSRLVLAALDRSGVLRTRPEDRVIEVEWPDPLPGTEADELRTALLRRELGADEETLRREAGLSLRNESIE